MLLYGSSYGTAEARLIMFPWPLIPRVPGVSLAMLSRLKALSAEIYDAPDLCRDQNVLLQVLRNTCLNEAFQSHAVELQEFYRIFTCADVSQYCLCNGRTCSEDDFEGQSTTMSWAWVDLLQGICPGTCKRCVHSVNATGATR